MTRRIGLAVAATLLVALADELPGDCVDAALATGTLAVPDVVARASAVASLSTGFRTIVPEECVADKHEIPHFANLCDIMLKYADVEPVAAVKEWLENHPGCEPIRQARGCSF